MSKAHRGKGIREQAAHGRGECPVCKRRNVKILYEQEAGELKVKICKICRAAVKHGRKSVIDTASAVKPAAKANPVVTESAAKPAPAEPAAESAAAPAAAEESAGGEETRAADAE
ncbi:MAG: hypothetical protein LBD71_01755 [Treponema sp.]|jgi:hypothetical protein|nr:hypothetical protein [Treponema sp.]